MSTGQQQVQRQREQTDDVWYMSLWNVVVANDEQMQSLGLEKRIHRRNSFHEDEIDAPGGLKRLWARQGTASGVMLFQSKSGHWRLPFIHGNSTQDEDVKQANLDEKVIKDMGNIQLLCFNRGGFEEVESDSREDMFCRVSYLREWDCNERQVFKHLTEKSNTHRRIGFAFWNPDGQCHSLLTYVDGVSKIEENADSIIHWPVKHLLLYVLV